MNSCPCAASKSAMESVGDVAERAGDVVRLTIDLSASESNDEYRVAAVHREAVETLAAVSVGFDYEFLYTPPPSPCPRSECCPKRVRENKGVPAC